MEAPFPVFLPNVHPKSADKASSLDSGRAGERERATLALMFTPFLQLSLTLEGYHVCGGPALE
jgi:hypothetical protein